LDCSLAEYYEEDGISSFRFDSKSNSEFWAQVTISTK
jgi:hypothetical protein